MSVYYEIITDLWRKDIDEFLNQALKLLDQLSPEEKESVIRLYVRSLPPEVIAKLLQDKPGNGSSSSVFQAAHP